MQPHKTATPAPDAKAQNQNMSVIFDALPEKQPCGGCAD